MLQKFISKFTATVNLFGVFLSKDLYQVMNVHQTNCYYLNSRYQNLNFAYLQLQALKVIRYVLSAVLFDRPNCCVTLRFTHANFQDHYCISFFSEQIDIRILFSDSKSIADHQIFVICPQICNLNAHYYVLLQHQQSFVSL